MLPSFPVLDGRANISAKFVVNVRGYTADDDDMVCLDLVVDFVS